MSTQFEHLFTPIKIGHRTVKNRIALPAHGTRFAFTNDEDDPTQYIEYIRARARGGCGLVVLGTISVHRTSSGYTVVVPPTPEIFARKLKKMADACHEYGAAVVVQYVHRGNEGDSELTMTGNWGFTELPSPSSGEVCHQMEDEEIEDIIDSYVRYSVAAREGGLDGVELHGAHGYMLQQSWTGWANQRTDKWGEQIAFARELIGRIRNAVGNDFIIGAKIPSDDFHPGGMDNEAMKNVARALEATGKLDYLMISEGSQLTHYSLVMGSMYIPPGAWVPLASGIKQAVKSIPIIATGRINDPALAESVLADGHADMVGLCRAQIADPEFADKSREGRVDDIRLCIACNQGCADRLFSQFQITCLQNAAVGKEKELGSIEPAPGKKKVLVVGGGPGGMEAARVAALRGHDVTLYEKQDRLGGQLNTLIKVPSREEFGQAIRYLTTQLGKLKVTVRLGTEATAETVKKEKPDAVIVATGSRPFVPPIPGSDQDNVFTVSRVLEGAPTGERVVVYDTTGLMEATTVAEFLADQGKKVEIVTPASVVGGRIGFTHQPLIWPRLLNKGIIFTTWTALKKISGRTLTLRNVFTEEERILDGVDTVVMATGYRANNSLYHALKGQVSELYIIGDSYAPLRALQAIHSGYKVARQV